MAKTVNSLRRAEKLAVKLLNKISLKKGWTKTDDKRLGNIIKITKLLINIKRMNIPDRPEKYSAELDQKMVQEFIERKMRDAKREADKANNTK